MIPKQVSLDHYRRESMKIAARFKEGLPGCELGESYFGHYSACLY